LRVSYYAFRSPLEGVVVVVVVVVVEAEPEGIHLIPVSEKLR